MHDSKLLSGLKLIGGTRLSLNNSNPREHAITVNGAQLSYNDIALGALQITDNKVYSLDEEDGQYYQILNTNSEIEIKFEDEVQTGKVASGQIIPAGASLFKQQSPAPFVFIDTTGRLGSANLWKSLWVANVMGYADVDKGSNTYKHGLVPEGSDVHDGLFLRKDGQWGQPSVWTGSVSENFLSLQDTPTTYTDNIDKYLRVSYAEGGSVVFDDLNTSKVPESTNLYYTDERANTRIDGKLQDNSITNISVSGTITCNEILAQSDRVLKENIVDLDSEQCMRWVELMKPKAYNFKKQKQQRRYGLIAQELEEVVPELVNSNQPTKSVNYLELLPILIGSIQQLNEEVQCLKYDLEIANNKISRCN